MCGKEGKLFPHAEAVEAGAVVVGQGTVGPESEAEVEPLRGGIRSADLEAEGSSASPAELAEDVLREPGAQAPAAEIGMYRQGVQAPGAPPPPVAAEEAHGPAGERGALAGEQDAGARIVQQAADLAGIEALSRMPETNGFEKDELRQSFGRGRSANEFHLQSAGAAARGAGARMAGRGRTRQYLFRRRMGR